MADQTTILFESITSGTLPTPLPVVSNKAKGCGYRGQSDPMHTVLFSTIIGFIGIVKIQGTLATTPAEADWYDIDTVSIGDGINPVPDATITRNFGGKHVWIRGIITAFTAGELNRVLFTHN